VALILKHLWFLSQFYSVVSPKVDALKMDPKFLDRNVNEGFSGGERKRNEILQLSVRFLITFSVLISP
jgi:Fe-S cluster assembly ATPase SufC